MSFTHLIAAYRNNNNTHIILNLFNIQYKYHTYFYQGEKYMMNLEIYYYNINIRLIALITFSIILSGFYLKILNHSENQLFIKEEKSLYYLQLAFWISFLTNSFDFLLPANIFGFFFFELILLVIIFFTFTYTIWKYMNERKFDIGLLFSSLPLILLFVLALGMD